MSETPEPTAGGLPTTLRAALNAGLLAGFLLGLVDGVVAGRRTGTEGALEWAGCLAASTTVYGLTWVVLLLLASPLSHWLWGRRPLVERMRRQLGVALGLGLFLELFWWSREFLFWGLPATDPKRLGATVVFLLLGVALGPLVVRLGVGLPRAVKWAAAIVIPVSFLAGLGFLISSRADTNQLGELNDRNRDLPNVLIFVVDALRSDVLGCYGDERVQTPVLDDLASRGVLFENAFVQAPFTWSSFGSILTGKYPRRHGLVKMAPGVRMVPNITLPWHLKSAAREPADAGPALQHGDFHGATFMTGTLSHGSGLLRGFDTYFEAMVGHDLVDVDSAWSVFRSELLLSLVRTKLVQRIDKAPVATEAVKWFKRNGHKRFVSMVHYYSTHTPYDPPARFRDLYVDPDYDGPIQAFYAKHRQAIESGVEPTAADEAQIRNLYYAGVTQADAMIGQVLDELERQGVLDDTLVIVTSDHGEELGDHGLWEHNFMYQTNLRVPLIMALPGHLPADRRVPALVETVDLVPTICDLMGLAVPFEPNEPGDDGPERGRVDGVSLLPLIAGEVASVKEFSFAENGTHVSIQDREWKLTVSAKALAPEAWEGAVAAGERPAQVYHLATDPDEHLDLFDQRPEQVVRLMDALRAWDATMPIPRNDMIESARDIENAAHLLEALGYADGVGHGVDEEDSADEESEGE